MTVQGLSQERSGRRRWMRGRSCRCNTSRILTLSRSGIRACRLCHALLASNSRFIEVVARSSGSEFIRDLEDQMVTREDRLKECAIDVTGFDELPGSLAPPGAASLNGKCDKVLRINDSN